jgi:hypothetical protein
MCAARPHKIAILIIAILICYAAFCRNIFINNQAIVGKRQKAKCGMLERIKSAEWGGRIFHIV